MKKFNPGDLVRFVVSFKGVNGSEISSQIGMIIVRHDLSNSGPPSYPLSAYLDEVTRGDRYSYDVLWQSHAGIDGKYVLSSYVVLEDVSSNYMSTKVELVQETKNKTST